MQNLNLDLNLNKRVFFQPAKIQIVTEELERMLNP